MYFVIGDYAAGMLIGALTAAGVRAIVWPGMDMVIAMFLGMVAGMVVSMLLALLLAPLLGMFHTMMPAMVVGMWGGMRLKASEDASTAFERDQLWVRAIMDVDVAIRRVESFAVGIEVNKTVDASGA